MTFPEWRDAFWAELEGVMGVPETIDNDDQRQIGGWIITCEPWAASYAVAGLARQTPGSLPPVTAQSSRARYPGYCQEPVEGA